MLDLFAGLGGASSAMCTRNWELVTVDVTPCPGVVSHVQDVRTFIAPAGSFDLVWASPPCDEFARESMPWCKTGKAPSLDLVLEAKRIIDEVRPKYWVIENVRGSVKYISSVLGPWKAHVGPMFLWGEFPPDIEWPKVTKYKQRYSGTQKALRSKVPFEVSEALAVAVETALAKSEALS